MRIVHCAGLYGNAKDTLDTLISWIKQRRIGINPIDVLVISGSLLAKSQSWNSEAEYNKFIVAREFLNDLKKRLYEKSDHGETKINFLIVSPDKEIKTLEDIADVIINRRLKGLEHAEHYKLTLGRCRQTMIWHYLNLKEKLSEAGIPAFVIPGENDISDLGNIFSLESLHFESNKPVKGVTFNGCGYSIPIPRHLLKEFYKDKLGEIKLKEVLEDIATHLSTENPDVAVVTMPPIGYFDHIYPKPGEVEICHGSKEIKGYIEKKKPKLVLCGNTYFGENIGDHTGFGSIDRSMVINPGNLNLGCTFAEVVLDRDKDVSEIGFYEIKKPGDSESITEIQREYMAKEIN